MFKAKVTVMLKKSVLDPQGAAIERALKSHGVKNVQSVRVGKVIELALDGASAADVERQAKTLADEILANPVMEEYAVSVEKLS